MESHNVCTYDNCIANCKINTTAKKTMCVLGNYCIVCHLNLGACNPRQYCGKTHCLYEKYIDNNVVNDVETKK